MAKKYEFTGATKEHHGVTVRQIRAIVVIAGVVETGGVGGWIESEKCLDHTGDAWVSGNAWVYGDARVSGDAWVYGNAQVSGNAPVSGNAQVSGDARVYGDARVSGNAWVSGDARVYGNAQVSGNAWVSGDAWVESKDAICWFSGFGSECRTTTAFIDKKLGIRIVCGCFTGSTVEFRKEVIETHGEYSKHGRLYIDMAHMIESRLDAIS